MKILIITFEFPPMGGGTGNYCLNLATSLVNNNHDVSVLTTSIKSNRKQEIILQNKHKNIAIRRANFPYKLWPIFGKYHIKSHLKKNTYDYILIGNYTAFLSLIRIKKELYKSAKIAYTLHGVDIDDLFNRTKKRDKIMVQPKARDLMFDRLDYIICVSNYLAAQAFEYNLSKSKIKVIHHGIDLNIFSPISKNLRQDARKKILQLYNKIDRTDIIFTAGRLDVDKGHDVLINTFYSLKNKLQNPLLIIAGDGPEKSKLEEQIKTLGLNNDTVFTGNLAREELIDIYQVADVFVMLSRRRGETFGLVYIEAMACGIPVIAGDNGAIHEIIIDSKYGLIIDPKSNRECEQAIIKLTSDSIYKDRIINNGIRLVKNNFSNNIMAKNTLKIFQLKQV